MNISINNSNVTVEGWKAFQEYRLRKYKELMGSPEFTELEDNIMKNMEGGLGNGNLLLGRLYMIQRKNTLPCIPDGTIEEHLNFLVSKEYEQRNYQSR